MKKLFLITLALPLLFSCTKEEKSNANTDIIEYNDSPTNDTATDQSSSPATTNHIVIKANDDMTYDKTAFTVKAGEEITLLLMNNGTMSKEAMGHNLVILKQGVDLSAFAFAASSEKDSDYIPQQKLNDIVAHTKLLGAKENDQIKVTFDTKGTYQFLCTFPGHAGTMKGTITVI